MEMASVDLKVAAVAGDVQGGTNCAFVNPLDITGAKYVLAPATGVIFTIKEEPTVVRGNINLNLFQRKSARVSNSSVPPDTLTVSAGYVPPVAVLNSLKLSIDFVSTSKVGGEVDYVEWTNAWENLFAGHYFIKDQQVLFIMGDTKYWVTIAEVEAAGRGGAASPNGQFIPKTTGLVLTATERSAIRIKNIPAEQEDKMAERVVNVFDLSKLGIGGLRKEFGEIFRRAFASRIFPKSVVKALGIKHVKGVLLYGPPGTGKTLIARKIGEILNCRPPKIVNGPEIFNKFVGVAEENIRKLFAEAEADWASKGEASPLHLIIFDEFDSICKQRGGGRADGNVSDNVVNQLLSKIDGVGTINNVLLIGMTNRKDLIDEAVLRPGRFEVHIEIGLPDENGRVEILQVHTREMLARGNLGDDVDISSLAAETKNFSGAELEGLVRSAQSFAMSRYVDFDNPGLVVDSKVPIKIMMADFLKSLSEVKPAFGVAKEELALVMRHGIIDYGPAWQTLHRRQGELVRKLVESPKMATLSLLISGPAGSGKSSFATHIAQYSQFPYVKMLSADSMVGYGEQQKTNIFRKVFDDAYKSLRSVIILDDLEQLVEFSQLGGRYSNALLQALIVQIKKPPPEGRKVLIVATCQSIAIMRELALRPCFMANLELSEVSSEALEPVCRGLHTNWRSAADLESAVAEIAATPLPIKRMIFLIDVASRVDVGSKQYFDVAQAPLVTDGAAMTKQQASQALEVDQSSVVAWIALGVAMPSTISVSVGDLSFTKQQCFIQAISLDAHNAVAWYDLGCTVMPGANVEVEGASVSQQDCFVKAVTLNPALASAWVNLGCCLTTAGTITIAGRSYNRAACFEQGIELSPTLVEAWCNVGAVMPRGGRHTIAGTTYAQKEIFERCVALNPRHARAWFNLGCCLSGAETTTVNGATLTEVQCYEQALALDSKHALTWDNIGCQLKPGQTFVFNLKHFGRQQCFEQARATGSRTISFSSFSESLSTAGFDAE